MQKNYKATCSYPPLDKIQSLYCGFHDSIICLINHLTQQREAKSCSCHDDHAVFLLFKHINLLPTSGCLYLLFKFCKTIISWWSLFIGVVSALFSQEFLHNKGHFLPSFPSPFPFFFSLLVPSSRPSTTCFDLNNIWNCWVTFEVPLSWFKAEPAS